MGTRQAERAEGKTEINDVYFARDGYLIEKHSGSFSTDTAKRNITYLDNFLKVQAQKYGEDHVKAMIVPNAVEILRTNYQIMQWQRKRAIIGEKSVRRFRRSCFLMLNRYWKPIRKNQSL
ncbi:MAG: hypothetical protein V8T31_08060 [Lachnospiraceae bacterium]